MRRRLVNLAAGGAGLIGSNFFRAFLGRFPDSRGVILDALVAEAPCGSGSGVFRMGTLRCWRDDLGRRLDRSGPLWAGLAFELWWNEVSSASEDALVSVGRPLRAVRT